MAAITIISPHLDDAAICCADHIKCWADAGFHVHVISLFSEFGSSEPSAYVKRFMRECGLERPAEYGAVRREEDRQAMQMLGVEYSWAGSRDAGFREWHGRPAYQDYRSLTVGRICAQELPVLENAKAQLQHWPVPDFVISPLGIGKHIDHLIAREACQAVWQGQAAFGYYLDFPYARNPFNYSLGALRYLKRRRISIKLVSDLKRTVIASYRTQMPYIVRGKARFPEVLLLPPQLAERLARSAKVPALGR